MGGWKLDGKTLDLGDPFRCQVAILVVAVRTIYLILVLALLPFENVHGIGN